MNFFLVSVLACVQVAVAHDWSIFDINTRDLTETIDRDVCVVGGGSSGVNAAVSLTNLNKTVMVVERNNYLGGHAYSYIDPASQIPIDIGVVIYLPIPVVYNYFNKLNVSLLNVSSVQSNAPGAPANKSLPAFLYDTNTDYVDFRNGSSVTRSSPYAEPGLDEALERYAEVLANYTYLLQGYDLPDPVPEDLYMPYGAFLEKYNITAAFPLVYVFEQGMGDVLNLPTIYVIKYYNLEDITIGLSGYVTQAQGNISELYTRAGEYIGTSNVLLESSVVSAKRQNTTSGHPELLVSTPNEGLKLLSCKQILLTAPPELSNLAGWDLTDEEYAVFSQFDTANGYWTGLVTNVGLNQTVSLVNSATQRPFNIPELPALYALNPVGVLDDVWAIKFGADNPTMTDEQVKSYIEREIQTLQRSQNATVTTPEWLVFQSHTPFYLQVKPEAIKDGFYKNLTALQGGLGGTMFYSGAAFHAHVSSLLWQFNQDVVIPKMMASA